MATWYSATKSTWYTAGSPHLHFHIYGAPDAIERLGICLHERTPVLDWLPHPRESQLFLNIDTQAMTALHYLQQKYGSRQVHQRFTVLPELLAEYGGPRPFRVGDLAPTPYQGKIGVLRLRPITLEEEIPLRYYGFVDTPTAEIARQVAPYFPTYCFTAQTARITYFHAQQAPFNALYRRLLRQAFPTLAITMRFDLPYESTSDDSPIQRLIYYPPYFSGSGQGSLQALGQLVDRFVQAQKARSKG